MKQHYKLGKKFLIVALTLLFSTQLFAQQITVTGSVVDESDGAPLPGVTILEKGTTNGTVTDIDGKFSLKAEQGATLVFSFIGYDSQEIPASRPA